MDDSLMECERSGRAARAAQHTRRAVTAIASACAHTHKLRLPFLEKLRVLRVGEDGVGYWKRLVVDLLHVVLRA